MTSKFQTPDGTKFQSRVGSAFQAWGGSESECPSLQIYLEGFNANPCACASSSTQSWEMLEVNVDGTYAVGPSDIFSSAIDGSGNLACRYNKVFVSSSPYMVRWKSYNVTGCDESQSTNTQLIESEHLFFDLEYILRDPELVRIRRIRAGRNGGGVGDVVGIETQIIEITDFYELGEKIFLNQDCGFDQARVVTSGDGTEGSPFIQVFKP